MTKQSRTIRRQFAEELFVFDHFVELALKGLNSMHDILSKHQALKG